MLDWQRASYVLYQGLGWTVAESDAGAAMDFAADAARAIETAVTTTIIGSVAEVVDGLHEVADAGVDDVVLRIAVEGAPQAAIHSVMRDFAEGVFPVLAGRGRGGVRIGVTLGHGDEVATAVAAEVRRAPVRPHRRAGGNRDGDRRHRRRGDVERPPHGRPPSSATSTR